MMKARRGFVFDSCRRPSVSFTAEVVVVTSPSKTCASERTIRLLIDDVRGQQRRFRFRQVSVLFLSSPPRSVIFDLLISSAKKMMMTANAVRAG